MTSGELFSPHGGYRSMRSFRCAQAVYDGTVVFCDSFIDKRSRTHDQMVQAARSGVQNIAEGSLASATSRKTELKLTSVARASLGELLLDFEDYLRQHKLRQWKKDDPEALSVRGKFRERQSDESDRSDKSDYSSQAMLYSFETLPAEVLANTLLCLINQASFLLWQQMKALEKEFLENGGFSEKMFQARKGIAPKK
jgi:four helix bundle suffix protein